MTEEQLDKLIDAVKLEGQQTRNTINSANSDNGCLPFIAMMLFLILMETCKL